MTTNYITFPIQITTLSPLHIGNGESISSAGEFLTTANNIQFLDQEDLMSRLQESHLLEEYVDKILAVQQGFDLFKVLSDWGIQTKALKTIKLNQTGLITTHNNILERCIKTNDLAYIPGSTIKGLLRTAILFNYLEQHTREWKTIEDDIQELINNGQSKKDINAYWVQTERTLLPNDVFQAIRPGDSNTIEYENLIIEQVNRQHFYGVESGGLDWLAECIQTDTDIPFELSILPLFEHGDFKYLKQGTIQSILKILNEHSLKLIQIDLELLAMANSDKEIRDTLIKQLHEFKQQIESSNNQFAIARIGKGKTLFFNTLLPLLSPPVRKDLINLIQKEAGIFPQSRVLTVVNKEMMGWIKIAYSQPKKSLVNNELQGEIKVGMELEALFLEEKKVTLMLNGETLEQVQLVNKFKQSFPYGTKINVLVHQLTKTGKINQVKLK